MSMTTKNLLVELFVEELPPKALKRLGEAFAREVFDGLRVNDFLFEASTVTVFASPRRLAVHITNVRETSVPKVHRVKLMPALVGLTPGQGNARTYEETRGVTWIPRRSRLR